MPSWNHGLTLRPVASLEADASEPMPIGRRLSQPVRSLEVFLDRSQLFFFVPQLT